MLNKRNEVSMYYGTNQLQLKWHTRVLSCERVCLCVPHVQLHASPISIIIITNLQPLSINFMFSHPFLKSSAHLNDAETRGEYPDNNLSRAPRIKLLNNGKNTGLKERNSFIARVKEHLEYFLVQSSLSRSNGQDILDNIYVHTELVDWLYHVNSATVCKSWLYAGDT